MKLAGLRCRACGRERLVREREKGVRLACDACGEPIEVPESLEFPRLAALYDDRTLVRRMGGLLALSFCTGCLPLAGVVWWHVEGAAQRMRDEGRPVEPRLRRVRNAAAGLTALQAAGWVAVAFALRR